jgi:hypothetical protein
MAFNWRLPQTAQRPKWCPWRVWNKFAISIGYDSQPAQKLSLNYNKFQGFSQPPGVSFLAKYAAMTQFALGQVRFPNRMVTLPSKPMSAGAAKARAVSY